MENTTAKPVRKQPNRFRAEKRTKVAWVLSHKFDKFNRISRELDRLEQKLRTKRRELEQAYTNIKRG
jgi:hypothetical protein